MKIVDIADEVYRELNEPTSLSIPAISYWLRANVGYLNNLIHTDYVINAKTLEMEDSNSDEIGEEEKVILKKMYMIHYYDQRLRTHMTTMDTDTILSVRDGDSSVTKVNRNEIAKSIAVVKAQEYSELKTMVAAYTGTKAKPYQVAGDDTVNGDSSSTTKYNRDLF